MMKELVASLLKWTLLLVAYNAKETTTAKKTMPRLNLGVIAFTRSSKLTWFAPDAEALAA